MFNFLILWAIHNGGATAPLPLPSASPGQHAGSSSIGSKNETNSPPTPKAKREQKPKYGPVSETAHTRQSCALQVRIAPFGAVAVVHSPTASRSFKNESVPPGASSASSPRLSVCTAHTPPPPNTCPLSHPIPIILRCVCRYKTVLCTNFEAGGRCRYGKRCNFAHGRDKLPSKRTAAEQPTVERFYAFRSRPFRNQRQTGLE